MSEIEHLVMPALRAAGRPTTYENQERMRKALTEAAHARAEAVGVKDASYTEMLIDNAACASQCDFDAVTREAIRLNIIDPLLALAHPAVPEWQPIETAPKNEEILIAYWRWRNSMSPGSVVVQSAQMTEFHGEGIWSWVVSDNKHGPFPIRGWSDGDILGWMPLPKPPVAVAKKEGGNG